MPPEARKFSENGFYHVVFGGINHQNIFVDEGKFHQKIIKYVDNIEPENIAKLTKADKNETSPLTLGCDFYGRKN